MRLAASALLCLPVAAAPAPNPPRLELPRLAQAPDMGRNADLSTWAGARFIQDFGLIMPDDQGPNRWPTTVHAAFGPDAFYVAVACDDPEPGKIRAARHLRDTNSGDFDFVGIDLDPSGKGQSAIRLFVTPEGGVIDEIFSDSAGENASYDLLWQAAGVRTSTGYLVKIRVPYASLRRMPGEWGLRVLRIIPRERRYGIVWPRMSRDIQCDLCQLARITGAPVDQPGAPFLVIPSVTSSRTQTLDPDPAAPARSRARLGLDLRYATSALTFEGTYRPDFATADADVDPLQLNSRFKVFYPERRPFFLEGMDLLGVQGAQRQFFSRSIQAPLYGLKASGQADMGSWSALHAKDQDGGLLLQAPGLEGLSSSDSAAAMRFRTDDRGSGVALVGTEKRLLGGPADVGGRSAGLYVDQYLGSQFHLLASAVGATSRLPEPDGSLPGRRGSTTSAELDWNTRHWNGWLLTQATSPDLALLSGFVDLPGYRRHSGGLTLRGNWNQGAFASANATVRYRRLDWWNGDPMERATGLDAWVETAGRISFFLNWDAAGRMWGEDPARSVAARSLTLGGNIRPYSRLQFGWNATQARTLDLASSTPARYRSAQLFFYGTVSSLSYNLTALQGGLDREADLARLVRARELTLTASWVFPLDLYVKAQAFVVRYDGSLAEGVDKFLKAFLGWQPNAFTQAYLGWSGQRRRDPLARDPAERMVERGLFAKAAYAFQF